MLHPLVNEIEISKYIQNKFFVYDSLLNKKTDSAIDEKLRKYLMKMLNSIKNCSLENKTCKS